MQFWYSELALHGYSILFAAVFMEAMGLPLPAALALLLAGGASARGSLHNRRRSRPRRLAVQHG